MQKINFDDSEILTAEELDAIAQDYVGKSVTLQNLYEIVEKVNMLYQEKGFIRLLEGKTADVTISGNKHTR